MSEHTCLLSIESQCRECTREDMEYGRKLEREAIVAWLTARRNIIASGIWFAREIENGTHLRSNNE